MTISDHKFYDSNDDIYYASVLTAQDYYPFGMQMPGRTYASEEGYRYGFNGQEQEPEINASVTSAEFWMYDARLGRRWNVDPVVIPGESPYASLSNNPIVLDDPNGDCATCDKPVKSEYLNSLGIDFGSFGNGVADGLIGAAPEIAEFVWNMVWSSTERNNFISAIKTILEDPKGTLTAIAEKKLNEWGNVLSGNGTEEEKYAVGKDVGNFLFGLATGAGGAKLFKVLKASKNEKLLLDAAKASDNAAGTVSKVAKTGASNGMEFLDDGARMVDQPLKQAAKGVTNIIPEGELANHLFKGAGKLADNPANRTLIQTISNGKPLVVDKFGKSWYRGVDANGKAIYSYTQNGIVKGAGYTNFNTEQLINHVITTVGVK